MLLDNFFQKPMTIFSFNAYRCCHDKQGNYLMFPWNFWAYSTQACNSAKEATEPMRPHTLMYLYSPSKPVSLGSGQTQQQQNESDTAGRAMFPALHPTLHDMFTRTPVERARLFVWEYADRAWGGSLLPRCSPQRMWLAALSRTETPASICAAALRPYWWAAVGDDKFAVCHSAPPAGEPWARAKRKQGRISDQNSTCDSNSVWSNCWFTV